MNEVIKNRRAFRLVGRVVQNDLSCDKSNPEYLLLDEKNGNIQNIKLTVLVSMLHDLKDEAFANLELDNGKIRCTECALDRFPRYVRSSSGYVCVHEDSNKMYVIGRITIAGDVRGYRVMGANGKVVDLSKDRVLLAEDLGYEFVNVHIEDNNGTKFVKPNVEANYWEIERILSADEMKALGITVMTAAAPSNPSDKLLDDVDDDCTSIEVAKQTIDEDPAYRAGINEAYIRRVLRNAVKITDTRIISQRVRRGDTYATGMVAAINQFLPRGKYYSYNVGQLTSILKMVNIFKKEAIPLCANSTESNIYMSYLREIVDITNRAKNDGKKSLEGYSSLRVYALARCIALLFIRKYTKDEVLRLCGNRVFSCESSDIPSERVMKYFYRVMKRIILFDVFLNSKYTSSDQVNVKLLRAFNKLYILPEYMELLGVADQYVPQAEYRNNERYTYHNEQLSRDVKLDIGICVKFVRTDDQSAYYTYITYNFDSIEYARIKKLCSPSRTTSLSLIHYSYKSGDGYVEIDTSDSRWGLGPDIDMTPEELHNKLSEDGYKNIMLVKRRPDKDSKDAAIYNSINRALYDTRYARPFDDVVSRAISENRALMTKYDKYAEMYDNFDYQCKNLENLAGVEFSDLLEERKLFYRVLSLFLNPWDSFKNSNGCLVMPDANGNNVELSIDQSIALQNYVEHNCCITANSGFGIMLSRTYGYMSSIHLITTEKLVDAIHIIADDDGETERDIKSMMADLISAIEKLTGLDERAAISAIMSLKVYRRRKDKK